MRDYLPLLFVLVIVAVLLREDTVLTLFYLLAGVYFAGRWWSRRALEAVRFKRTFVDRAFPGEEVPVRLEVANTSLLPVVWLSVLDSLPVEVSARSLQEVVSLGPRGKARFDYLLQPYKRGYYPVGPLFLSSGDLLGLAADDQKQGRPDHLTVYPRIVPLTKLDLPSRSPLGTLRHTRPIFEDPTRITGKRDYVSGDSLRRVDWKATAAAGRLQVKMFEPSIALETVIFLNLNTADYELKTRYDSPELAIVVAASIASWVVGRRQAVGLIAAGADPSQTDPQVQTVPARKGRGHLMRVLEMLARIQPAESSVTLAQRLGQTIVGLPWGTTLVLITGRVDESLLDALFQARRAGLNVVLIPTSPAPGFEHIKRRAERFGFVVYPVYRERDMDMWRR